MSNNNFSKERGESIKQYDICIGDLKLEYKLYEAWLDAEQRSSYSISVTTDSDSIFAHDVTSMRHTALRLLDTVRLGEVTPCTLLDVLEDLL